MSRVNVLLISVRQLHVQGGQHHGGGRGARAALRDRHPHLPSGVRRLQLQLGRGPDGGGDDDGGRPLRRLYRSRRGH